MRRADAFMKNKVCTYVCTYIRMSAAHGGHLPPPPIPPAKTKSERERERDARALPCKTHDAFRCAWTVCSNCASCANLSSSSAIAPGLQLSLRQQARRQRARGGEQTLLSAQFATRSTCRMHTARFGRAPRRINQQPMPLHACQCTNNPCPFGNSTCTYVVKLAAFVTETGPRARHASERHIRRPRYVVCTGILVGGYATCRVYKLAYSCGKWPYRMP